MELVVDTDADDVGGQAAAPVELRNANPINLFDKALTSPAGFEGWREWKKAKRK